MRQMETKKVDRVVIKDVICNKCGNSMLSKAGNFEGLCANFSGGYGSKWDGGSVEFDLCENCLVELFASFKIEPATNTYDTY